MSYEQQGFFYSFRKFSSSLKCKSVVSEDQFHTVIINCEGGLGDFVIKRFMLKQTLFDQGDLTKRPSIDPSNLLIL